MSTHNPETPFEEYLRRIEQQLKGQTAETPPPTEEKTEKELPEFNLNPLEMEAYLNRHVVDQQEAVSIIATKICTHFNRIRLLKEKSPIGLVKNNILMLGPTGVGKTFIIKLIADKLGVPFAKGDATKFTETGYVGGDVDDLVRDLVKQTDGDISLAEHGIIYIDEIDKIAGATSRQSYRDVSGAGVQRNLLKLMEETEVDLKPAHDLAAQMESMIETQRTGKPPRKLINTRNILFIVSGAFQGLEEIIRSRLNKQPMGFGREILDTDISTDELLRRATIEDFIEYGFESEFIARLPIMAVLNHLDEDSLYKILTNPESAVILGKRIDFESYGISIDFDVEALKLIAQKAAGSKTGARSLSRIIEEVLIPYEKQLPASQLSHLQVTKKIVQDPRDMLTQLIVSDGIARFVSEFEQAYQIKLVFSDDAMAYLENIFRQDGVDVKLVLDGILKDFAYGLKLTQITEQHVTNDILENPRRWMDKLIKDSWRPEDGPSQD